MCIRDSYRQQPRKKTGLGNGVFKRSSILVRIRTVSYTHLDVYKRQLPYQIVNINVKKLSDIKNFMKSSFAICVTILGTMV